MIPDILMNRPANESSQVSLRLHACMNTWQGLQQCNHFVRELLSCKPDCGDFMTQNMTEFLVDFAQEDLSKRLSALA